MDNEKKEWMKDKPPIPVIIRYTWSGGCIKLFDDDRLVKEPPKKKKWKKYK